MLNTTTIIDYMQYYHAWLIDRDQYNPRKREGEVKYKLVVVEFRPLENKYKTYLKRYNPESQEWEQVIWRGKEVTLINMKQWVKAEIIPYVDLPSEKGAKPRFKLVDAQE